MQEVVAAVELDLDRLQTPVFLGGQAVSIARVLPEMLFLVGQGVDPPEDVAVDHCSLLFAPPVRRHSARDRDFADLKLEETLVRAVCSPPQPAPDRAKPVAGWTATGFGTGRQR